jgi:hypothetical protein
VLSRDGGVGRHGPRRFGALGEPWDAQNWVLAFARTSGVRDQRSALFSNAEHPSHRHPARSEAEMRDPGDWAGCFGSRIARCVPVSWVPGLPWLAPRDDEEGGRSSMLGNRAKTSFIVIPHAAKRRCGTQSLPRTRSGGTGRDASVREPRGAFRSPGSRFRPHGRPGMTRKGVRPHGRPGMTGMNAESRCRGTRLRARRRRGVDLLAPSP